MKNILTKIEFSTSYIIVALGFVLVGYYKNLIIFTSLIIIHELGHYLMAKINNINVTKICIYPYGGLVKMNCKINTSNNKELLVAISGIITQTIYYYVIYFLFIKGIINDYTFNIFKMYHYNMLVFNLLPIIPLDGYKIINNLLNRIFSYKKSNSISIYLSLFILISLIITIKDNFNYTYVFIISIFLKNIYTFYDECEYLFNKFLLERYLYNFDFKKTKIINNYNNMYKDHNHIIKDNNKYIREKPFLIKMFDNKKHLW